MTASADAAPDNEGSHRVERMTPNNILVRLIESGYNAVSFKEVA